MLKFTLVSAAALALLASTGVASAQNTTVRAFKAPQNNAGMAARATQSATITATNFGTSAPPATLGGIPMEKVPAGHACTGESPGPASSSFGSVTPVPADVQRCIGGGWATWSHGYVGDVWYTGGATSQTISLPPGVSAAYAYVEPNPFSIQTCNMTATGSSGSTSTGGFPVDGSGGAVGWGFVESAGTISSITVTCDVDFATGAYGVGGRTNPCDFDGNGDYDRADLFGQLRACIQGGQGGCIIQLIETVIACGRPGQ